jgi:hypothetical protein
MLRASTAATMLLAVTAALVTGSAAAHHSDAIYDEHQTITLQGTVTRYVWSNPHVYIYFEQRDASGHAIEWEVEGSPPSILRRVGWSPVTFHAGDAITVTGRPTRTPGRKSLYPRMIKLGNTTVFDGKTERAQLERVATVAAKPKQGFDGVWVTVLALGTVATLDDPKKLSLTAEGSAALKRFDEKTMNPGVNCVPNPAPVFMVTPDLKRITSGQGIIVIEGAFDAAMRTIHMDTTTHEGVPVSIQGHSIGRWEGESLVIDTAQFAYHSLGNSYGVPSGTRKHLRERLTPNADGKSLTYHFELTDPEYLAAPVTGDVRWVFRPDLRYAPDKCNRESARRFIED